MLQLYCLTGKKKKGKEGRNKTVLLKIGARGTRGETEAKVQSYIFQILNTRLDLANLSIQVTSIIWLPTRYYT